MFKAITIALALFLASCGPVVDTGEDDYIFEKAQYEQSQVVVNYKTFTDRSVFNAEMKKKGLDPKVVRAFSILTPGTNRCTIYMMHPSIDYEPAMAGHELTHCVYGEWHPSMNKRIDSKL